jgi:hypothetical protein
MISDKKAHLVDALFFFIGVVLGPLRWVLKFRLQDSDTG